MSKYEVDVWEYADEFKNLDTNETFGGYAVCELLEQKDKQITELQKQLEEKEKDNQNYKKSNEAYNQLLEECIKELIGE